MEGEGAGCRVRGVLSPHPEQPRSGLSKGQLSGYRPSTRAFGAAQDEALFYALRPIIPQMPSSRAFGGDVGEVIGGLSAENTAVGSNLDAGAAHGGDFFGVVG